MLVVTNCFQDTIHTIQFHDWSYDLVTTVLVNNCSREQLFTRTAVRERVGLSRYCHIIYKIRSTLCDVLGFVVSQVQYLGHVIVLGNFRPCHGIRDKRKSRHVRNCDFSRSLRQIAIFSDSRDESRLFQIYATNRAFSIKSEDQIRAFSFKSEDRMSRFL